MPLDAKAPRELLGHRIGRFSVLELLGRGGMGTVVAAYDEHLDRKVAIKVLHENRAGDEDDQQRLWREAQALARFSHPNVVTVHEVGRHRGGVFVAMEFVRGQSLGAWQRTEPGWRAVLDAYVQAGQGLKAAHEVEMVHRDFKPSNVMRTKDGLVKVLDFGLARHETDASPKERVSEMGRRRPISSSLTESDTVVGTPPYMAPEQHDGEHVDARSDQYGYCVALWEGLTGARPFLGIDFDELLANKQQGAPRWPTDAPDVPPVVVRALQRGLSPKAEDRWPSMDELLRVLRWDPSRRRWRWVLGLSIVALVGLGGTTVFAWAQARAERCGGARAKLASIWDDSRRAEAKTAVLGVDRPYAPDVWSRTEQGLDTYASAWVEMHTEACEATTVRGEQSQQMLDLRMRCLHLASVDLQATVDTLADADPNVVDKAHQLVAKLPPLSRCADTGILETKFELPLPHEAERVKQARQRLARSRSERAAGRATDALAEIEALTPLLDDVEYGPVQARRALERGRVLDALGKYDAAEVALTKALELASREKLWDELALAAEELMVLIGYGQRRMDEGLRYWPMVQGLSEKDPERFASAHNSLGTILKAQGKYEQAETELRAALASWERVPEPHELDVARVRNNLGVVFFSQGKYEQAVVEYRAALSLREKALGPGHPVVARSRNNLGAAYYSQGKHEQAEIEYRSALLSWENALGAGHPDVASGRNNLGAVLQKQGKYERAEVEFRAALSSWAKTLGAEHPDVARARNNLGTVLDRQGKYEEAEAQLRAAVASWEKMPGAEKTDAGVARKNLGLLLEKQGKYEEAEVELRAALASWEKSLGADHPHVVPLLDSLASLLLREGRMDEALQVVNKAWTRHREAGVEPHKRARTAFVLARVLWSIEGAEQDRARALDLAKDAAVSYRVATGQHAEELKEVEQWLDLHRGP
ncbi:MAG: tetratricopeptide repeat protein [Myxococcota bacterium]